MKNFTQYLIGAAAALTIVGWLAFSPNNPIRKDNLEEKKTHRIVFQITSPDTAVYRALLRQLDHVLEYWPDAQLEVVAHSKGISMLVAEKSNVRPEIAAMKARGVQFLACENTLRVQKIEKSKIVAESGFIPVGLAEIAERQEQGWSYIKAGF